MQIAAECCIAGGGPAGMMLGLLLARAGRRVVVLEKHGDFLRDFRGDTIHPSTLELLHELGLLDAFLKLPQQRVSELQAQFGGMSFPVADFSRLPVRCPFIALIPQWDFLAFLAENAKRYPGFKLLMQAEATGLLFDGDKVSGVKGTSPQGAFEVRAGLVVGADGRHSTVREQAQLEVLDLGAPIDVLWFRLSRRPRDPQATMARFGGGQLMVMLNRGDYWQCAFVIAKGSLEVLRSRGLDAFRARLTRSVPFAADRMDEIDSWDKLKLLTVQVNRLRQWHRAGLLCIGDAAHAMSPVGGVGINLAIQDAVAAANVLWKGDFSAASLRAVQRRREFPTRITQAFQVVVQNNVLMRVLADEAPLKAPLAVRLLARWPALRRMAARMVGLGARPEHIGSPIAA
ncbi:MAG TPA: FAD-dependent oxidoreductase [Burkholderiales bacterium]|jgi:2-polyprenyl-6-methoxyphenol hydroxylase-like FAD-dependent oxidoreductase